MEPIESAAQWVRDNPVPDGVLNALQKSAIETYASSAYLSGLVAGAKLGLEKLDKLVN